MSPCFRSKLYPGLKRSSALISQADRRFGVDIATVDCGTSTSWEDCHSEVDITTVDFWTGGFSSIIMPGQPSGATVLGKNLLAFVKHPYFGSSVMMEFLMILAEEYSGRGGWPQPVQICV